MSDNKYTLKQEFHYESINVEWEITDFFSNGHIFYYSPIFSFAENKWMLCLKRRSRNCIWLHISNVINNNGSREGLRCKFGVKKMGGDLHFPNSPILFITSLSNERGVFLRLGHDLTLSNNLTIVCTLQHTCSVGKLPGSREYAPLKLIKFDALSKNFKRLSADKDSCDVILRVKGEVLNAHKAVLRARSSVFAAMFHHDMLENQTDTVTIPDCDPDSFQKFLEYFYTGELDVASFYNIYHIYIISDKYDVQELKSFCTEYMEKCLTEDIMCDIVMLADMYNEAKLFSVVQDFFYKNAYKVVETTQWESFIKNNFLLANRLLKMIQDIK